MSDSDSNASEETERTVNFQFSWPFEVSQFSSCPFDQSLCSPAFKTVHSNIGFDWRIVIYPNGEEEYRNHLGFYIEFLGNRDVRSIMEEINLQFLVEKDRKVEVRDTSKFDFDDPYICGVPEFLPKSVEDIRAEDLIPNDDNVLKLGVIIEIPEKLFDWQTILKEKDAKIDKDLELNFSRLFANVVVVKDTAPPPDKRAKIVHPLSHPPEDEKKVLDFKILTSDGATIWCHKVVLGEKNSYFGRMIATDMKEGTSNQVEVIYDAEMMLELIRFIYTGDVSEKFDKFDLRVLLDGAEKYELAGLKLICERKLVQKLKVRNAAEYLELADLYGLKILREVAVNLASANTKNVRRTPKGKRMQEELWEEILDVSDKRIQVVKLPDMKSD